MYVLKSGQTTKFFDRTSNYTSNQHTAVVNWKWDIQGDGVVNRPNWRRLPRLQKSQPLAYAKMWRTFNYGWRIYSHTETGPSGSTYWLKETGPNSGLFPDAELDAALLSDADYKALKKLLDQLKGEGANLANMLGERKQVASSVKSALMTIAYTGRDLRRGNITSAIRRMGGDPKTARSLRKKDIAGQWLSLQYGWKPLLSDVYDIVNSLHEREAVRCAVFRASVKSIAKLPSQTGAYQHPSGSGKTYGVRNCLAIAKYMVRASPNMSLAEPAALGFTNPLTVLWEVTPWSFVVDWFLPIGAYLDQLSADHGWNFIDGCFSSLQKADAYGAVTYAYSYTSAGWTYTNNWSQWSSSSCVYFRRTVLTGFPTPKLPRLKNPFSIGHLENALALAYQAFGRDNVSIRARKR